jgi:DHA3 family macrolide efflux protein-like MFS transporter
MYQTIMALFMILGPIIGTFIYQHYGISVAIGVMGVAFILSAAVLLLLPPDFDVKNRETKTTIWQELMDGFRYVIRNRALTMLGGCFAAAGFALGLTQPLTVFLITEQLGLPKEQLQWVMAAFGMGMIVGGGLTMAVSKNVTPAKLLAAGMFVNVVGFLVLGLSEQFWLTLTTEFVCGLFMPCIHIGINTLILQNTEANFIGRVNGILSPLFMGAMVLTMTASGWLKATFSLVTMYEAASVLFFIGILSIVPLLKSPMPQEK